MKKVTKKDIKLLESGIGMNWSDMKKIETRLSCQIKDLQLTLVEQAEMIVELSSMTGMNKQSIIKLENEREQPKLKQLKQLDQSVFDGQDEKWRFAAVDEDGHMKYFKDKPYVKKYEWLAAYTLHSYRYYGYDTTDWQNSLIERDKLELTGSDLCRKMLERGDKYVMCYLSGSSDMSAKDVKGIVYGYASNHEAFKVLNGCMWSYAVPVNNQGEPLTASEVGL